MKVLTQAYHYIVFVFALLTVAVLFMFYMQPVAFAQPATLPDGQLTGWGWTDTFGWISLNCVNVYAGENNAQLISHCANNNGYDYGISLNQSSGDLSGSAWSTNVGWIDFNPTIGAESIGSLPIITGGDEYAYTVRLDVSSGYLEGWAVATFKDTDPNNNAWIRFRAGNNCVTGPPEDITEDNYCVRMNENGYLAGWAWSGGDDGLGWIYFDETFSGGPYIQTKYGDVYSGGSITGSRAPEGAYNATYCIVSNSSNQISLSSSKACLIGNINIDFPSSANQAYTTSIVSIDLQNLLAQSQIAPIEVTSNDYILNSIPSQLNGGVYYFSTADSYTIDKYSINSSLSFQPVSNASGAGTIVIDGDLYINKNISYQTGLPTNINEVASIAWIVLGDVHVDKSVTKLVGTFVVLGDNTNNSGKFYTGDDASGGVPLQFSFLGMVAAKEIVLERTFFEGLAPAEIFEYDGRVLLNTPPGLGNFVGHLPEWSR